MCIKAYNLSLKAIDDYMGVLIREAEPLEEKKRLHSLSDAEQDKLDHIYNDLDFCNRELISRGRLDP